MAQFYLSKPLDTLNGAVQKRRGTSTTTHGLVYSLKNYFYRRSLKPLVLKSVLGMQICNVRFSIIGACRQLASNAHSTHLVHGGQPEPRASIHKTTTHGWSRFCHEADAYRPAVVSPGKSAGAKWTGDPDGRARAHRSAGLDLDATFDGEEGTI